MDDVLPAAHVPLPCLEGAGGHELTGAGEQPVRQLAALMKLLANEDRLRLLAQLAGSELCVGELGHQLGIQQPTLSQQLGVLRAGGVVQTRRDGKHVYYRLADGCVIETLRLLCGLRECAGRRPAAQPLPRD